jgi:hypothetical protein
VSPEAYRGFGFPGADSLGNHFQFLRDFEDYFCGARDPNFARGLNPSLQTFKMWLTQNKNAIPLEGAASTPNANGLIRLRSGSLVEASSECHTVDDGD